ncbi:hypothetical protein CC78DRAFT_564063 [Lojkania enalia]|uniref:Uncharacterized protein n=1 Tax=Lojkania enalia TaxID=147567 RepID=A0A9P4TRS8_9PLEO|nr:hypothetical protein CC78DRAFT_564063 [Didymosphaeria enalia]
MMQLQEKKQHIDLLEHVDRGSTRNFLLRTNYPRRDASSGQPLEIYQFQATEARWNDIPTDTFTTIWHEVWIQASTNNSSIQDIVIHLQNEKLIRASDDEETISRAINLVFAIIGWQTMLYRPDMGSCPQYQLAIVDETNGYRGQAYIQLTQGLSTSRNALYEFLMGFGVLLPCHNFGVMSSNEDKKASRGTKDISPASFNMHLLTHVAGIHIKWTDSLACHLEFDADSNTVYLFRFPAFCDISLLGYPNDQAKTTLHSCAAPSIGASHWASREEVNDILRETLLSYRLLFAQNKSSRKLFRSLNPFEDLPEDCKDHSLSKWCGRKQIDFTTSPRELDTYILSKDFPILRSRLATLAQHLSYRQPRTWRELWNDKRDSATWFTFWAVLIIGGIGIFLAFLQVVLQIVQVSLQLKES